MKNQVCGVYKIQNNVNEKIYIGSSFNVSKRFMDHLSRLKNNIHRNKHLQSSVNKYGINNFTFSIVEECKEDFLIEREQFYIDSYDWKKLYNKTKVAYSGGSNAVEIPLILLDLTGKIIKEYKSGAELARDLNLITAPYTTINTSSILKKTYRIVSKEFYANSLEMILKWRPYSNETEYQKLQQELPKYKIITDEKTYLFFSLLELGNFLGISSERSRQLIGKKHKRTGHIILTNK